MFGWFDWQDLYSAFVERATDGARVVECGTFFGLSAAYLADQIARSGKQITFDTWDNWAGVPPEYELGYPGWVGAERPSEELARRNLSGLPVRVRTGDAIAAAGEYEDASLDLVFLDDDHTTDHVLAECRAWWPKVKPGGAMAGHDADWPSVRRGVDAWAAESGVKVDAVSARCWGAIK